MLQDTDIFCISNDPSFTQRAHTAAQSLSMTFQKSENVDEYSSLDESSQAAKLILLSGIQEQNQSQVAGMIQVVKQFSPHGFLVVVMDKKASLQLTEFMKKSGAHLVLLEEEYFQSSKLEFIATQKITAQLVPVKANELKVNTAVPFTLYHILPMNKKLLPVLTAQSTLSESKLKKFMEVGELYIQSKNLVEYQQYLKDNLDLSAKGLQARCRAQFLLLAAGFAELALLLTDNSEAASYTLGKQLYEKTTSYAKEMLEGLAAVGDAFQIISNASTGEFDNLSRSPAVAAYAGLLSLNAEIGDSTEVMMSSLLANLGLLELPPQLNRKVFTEGRESLNANERELYESHPMKSINLVLSRKLPLDEKIKKIILHSHEQVDMKGFPNRPVPEKIPIESQLIHLCERMDQATVIKMGHQRKSPKEVLSALLMQELEKQEFFSLDFLEKVRRSL